MTWLIWRQHRRQAITAVAALGVTAVALVITGLGILATYHSALRTCSVGLGGCSNLDGQVFQGGYNRFFDLVDAVGFTIPIVFAIFWARAARRPRDRGRRSPAGLDAKHHPAPLAGRKARLRSRRRRPVHRGVIPFGQLVVPAHKRSPAKPVWLGHFRHPGLGADRLCGVWHCAGMSFGRTVPPGVVSDGGDPGHFWRLPVLVRPIRAALPAPESNCNSFGHGARSGTLQPGQGTGSSAKNWSTPWARPFLSTRSTPAGSRWLAGRCTTRTPVSGLACGAMAITSWSITSRPAITGPSRASNWVSTWRWRQSWSVPRAFGPCEPTRRRRAAVSGPLTR